MTLKADLYFSYRSPYSYFAAQMYRRICEEWDVEISLRVVYPIAVRDPDFFNRESPLWVPYLLRDIFRVGEYLDMPIGRPNPDPIVMDMATRAIAAEQPLIRPISYLGVEANRQGKGLAFAAEVSRMIWSGTEGWNNDAELAGAAERAGLVLAGMRDRDDEAAYEAEILANQDALEKAGHWGVPTLVFMNEPFFGQDRVDMALWRMKKAGLARR
ncbi:MAG: DsbA family protein [Pseudomonadota bacterium]